MNIALGLTRLWRRSVEARTVRQVRAWPGLDAYHAELLGAAEPLCRTDHQPDRLDRNFCRAADVAHGLMREHGVLCGGEDPEVVEGAAQHAVLTRHRGGVPCPPPVRAGRGRVPPRRRRP